MALQGLLAQPIPGQSSNGPSNAPASKSGLKGLLGEPVQQVPVPDIKSAVQAVISKPVPMPQGGLTFPNTTLALKTGQTIQDPFPSLKYDLLAPKESDETDVSKGSLAPDAANTSMPGSTPIVSTVDTSTVAQNIASALMTVPKSLIGVVKGIATQETTPDANVQQIEKTMPGGSDLLGSTDKNGLFGATVQDLSIPAKAMTRFFAPIVQGAGQNIADAIIANNTKAQDAFAPTDQTGKPDISLLPSAQESVLQGVGNFMQLAFAVATPEIGGKLGLGGASEATGADILRTLGTQSSKDAFAPLAKIVGQAAVNSGIHGAEAGIWFGTAQAFSNGETDPAQIGSTVFKSALGLGLLGAVIGGGTVTSDIAKTALTKDIISKYNLPSSVYISADKINEYVNTGKLTDADAKALFDQIGGLKEMQRQAKEQGTSVTKLKETGAFFNIPLTDVLQISDKPYFAKIKEAFGLQPEEGGRIIEAGTPTLAMNKQLPAAGETAVKDDTITSAVKADIADNLERNHAPKDISDELQKQTGASEAHANDIVSTVAKEKGIETPELEKPTSDEILQKVQESVKPTTPAIVKDDVISREEIIKTQAANLHGAVSKGETYTPEKEPSMSKEGLSLKQEALAQKTARTATAKTYYGNFGEEGFKEVVGKKVEILPNLDTFVHKIDNKTWRVSERKSGMKIADAKTQAGAIEEAKVAIKKGLEKTDGLTIQRVVEDAVKRNGLSPAYGGKKPVTGNGTKNKELFTVPEDAKGPEKAFLNSKNQVALGGTNLVIGDYGRNAIERKTSSGQEDRLPLADLDETVGHIENSYVAGDSPFRKDNIVHVAKMPDGETRAVVTRENADGKEEVINFFKIGRPVEPFIKNLESFGAPDRTRTDITSLERSKPNPLADEGNKENISDMDKEVNERAVRTVDKAQQLKKVMSMVPEDKVVTYKLLAKKAQSEDEFISTLKEGDDFNEKNAEAIIAGDLQPKPGIQNFDIPEEAYKLSSTERTRLRDGVKWTPEEALKVVRTFFTAQESEFLTTEKPIQLGVMHRMEGTVQGLAYQGLDIQTQQFRSYIKILSEGGKVPDGIVLHEVFEKAVQIAFDDGVFGKVVDRTIKNPLSMLLRDYYSPEFYDSKYLRAKELLSDDFAEWYRDQKGYTGDHAGLWEKLLQFIRSLWRRMTGADKLYEDLTKGVRMKTPDDLEQIGASYGLKRSSSDDAEIRAREFYRRQNTDFSVGMEKPPREPKPKIEPKTEAEKPALDPKEMINMAKEIEKMKPVGGFRTALREVATLFNPVGQADPKAVDVLMKHKGEYERSLFRTEQTMRSIKKMWDKQPEDARLDFMDKVETGRIGEIEPAFRELATIYRDRLDSAHKTVTQFKNINFLENFFPHFWKDQKAVEKSNLYAKLNARKPLQGSKSFTKERVFETIKEGVDAGYELETSNPEELMQIYEQNVQKFAMANEIKQDMLERGFWKTVVAGQRAPDGFTRIDDAISKVYLNPNIPILEAYDEIATNKLKAVIDNLGIANERKYSLGRGKAGFMGFTQEGSNSITTKFASPLSVMAHELGHQLDYKYGLQSIFVDPNLPTTAKELRALADLRYEGHNATAGYKAYVRSGPEKMAVMLEALIHAPEKFKEVAPITYGKFTDFLSRHAELKPLLDVKPSLVMGVREDSVYAGGTVLGAEHYAQADIARLINNYLSKDWIMDSVWGKGIMNLKNTMNAFELGFSAFHITMETLDTVISKFAIGLGKISQGNLGGLKDMFISGAAPVTYFNAGRKFYNGDPELAAIEKDLFTGGASLRDKQYYKNGVFDTFMKKNREIAGDISRGDTLTGIKKAALQVLRVPLTAIEATMRPIFTYYIPRLKVGAFRDLFAAELERNSQKIQDKEITREQVARNVWNNIENRMGELNYDNLFWKRSLKTSLMLTTRAVGWNLGTIREIGGAIFQDLPKGFGATAGSRDDFKKYGFDFTPKMGYTLSLFFMVAMISTVYQFLHTGKGPSSVKDLFYPKNGATDANGEAYRVEFPTYLKDIYQSGIPQLVTGQPFAAADSAISMVKNKAAPELNTIIDLLMNKDFYDNMIRNPNDNAPTQLKQVTLYLLSQFEPFTIQQQQNLASGKSTPEQQAEAFLGIIKAPKDIIQSDYAKQLQALYTNQSGGHAPETPEQQVAQTAKYQVVDQIKKGDYSGIQSLLDQGILKPKGVRQFIQDALLSTPQKQYKGLSPENKAKLTQ